MLPNTMSTQGTPKRTLARRRTGPRRPSKSASKLREERERRNADKTANKRQDPWFKIEETLNHLGVVGLGDGVPLQIQQAVRQKLSAARRALQKRSDPLEITRPLLDLSNVISEQGIKTGALINRHLSGIKFFMEEATKEKAEHRTVVTANTSPRKDVKGVEMKKMLDKAKGILGQLSELNELRLVIKNAVEMILKTTGYILENPTPAIYRVEAEYDKMGLFKSSYGQEFDLPPKTHNWKKIEGILDHVMRVCQRPNIAKDLQQTMMTKVCASRKQFLRRSDPMEICKPLHELIDILNRQGLQSSVAAKSQLEEVQAMSLMTLDNDEVSSTNSSAREKNCMEVRKALGQAKTFLNYLSDLNELKMIIKNSADLIQRGGVSTVEDAPNITPLFDLEFDSTWDVPGLAREIDKMPLPSNLKVAVKVTMSRMRKILGTPSGNALLQDHLENLRDSLKSRTPGDVAMACYSLIAAVTDYQKTHWCGEK